VQKVNIAKLQQELKANPLADGSTPEILVDNDSQKMTTITGPWRVETKSKGGYGPSYLVYEGQGGETATVRFTPDIVKAGKYRIYAYFPRLAKSASELGITVSDGKSSKSIPIKTADIVVVGQTSGEWVALGDYELPKGQASSVEIAAKQVDGPVVADAVLFVPAF
jgi:hypothetical protein